MLESKVTLYGNSKVTGAQGINLSQSLAPIHSLAQFLRDQLILILISKVNMLELPMSGYGRGGGGGIKTSEKV